MWTCSECGDEYCDGCDDGHDEEVDLDFDLLSLAVTPEGLDLEPMMEAPYRNYQDEEDERARREHEAAWLKYVQEKQRRAA